MKIMKYFALIITFLLTNNVIGQTVLYSELRNNNWDIYSISTENGITNRITKNSLKDFQADYSTIQGSIVFDSYSNGNKRNIYRFNVHNGEIIQLTNLDTRDGHPVWSPKGSKIAFQSSRTGNSEVFIMDSNGKNIQQLTFNPEYDGIPKWSPDGKFLAFNSNRNGFPNVFTLNLETIELVQITSTESYNFIQDWISQTEILIISEISEKRQMKILDIKSKSLSKIIPTDNNVTYARSNKNGQIVFTQKTDIGEVNVFLTDIENNSIKQLTNSNNEKRFPVFME
jgi:Tol biopolymer transport system component